MKRYEFAVEGMACSGCEESVANAVGRVEGVHRVQAAHETGEVSVTADDGAKAGVIQAIRDAGYDVVA